MPPSLDTPVFSLFSAPADLDFPVLTSFIDLSLWVLAFAEVRCPLAVHSQNWESLWVLMVVAHSTCCSRIILHSCHSWVVDSGNYLPQLQREYLEGPLTAKLEGAGEAFA